MFGTYSYLKGVYNLNSNLKFSGWAEFSLSTLRCGFWQSP